MSLGCTCGAWKEHGRTVCEACEREVYGRLGRVPVAPVTITTGPHPQARTPLLRCGTCGVWVVEHQARVVAACESWAGQNVCQRDELLAMLERLHALVKPEVWSDDEDALIREAKALIERVKGG